MMVGIVVGAGFTALVNSFVKGVITPPLGLLSGNIDFAQKEIVLKQAQEGIEAITITYGQFITELINFILLAFAVFLIIKLINVWRERGKEEKTESEKRKCSRCFMEIHMKATRCPHCTSEQ